MAWSISDLFGPWGDAGEQPPDNFQYDGGDQVNEKHFDYLWSSMKTLEDDVRSALTDIDADSDGVVDSADSATSATDATNVTSTYKGNDIDSDGDGVVDNADQVDGYEATELQGGLNLPSADIASGDFTALARMSFPAGKTLTVSRASIVNGSFNSPAGLDLIVYDQTNNTSLGSYNGYSEPNADLDVGGKDVVIAADNGNFGGGSGSDQTNVTAVLDGIIN